MCGCNHSVTDDNVNTTTTTLIHNNATMKMHFSTAQHVVVNFPPLELGIWIALSHVTTVQAPRSDREYTVSQEVPCTLYCIDHGRKIHIYVHTYNSKNAQPSTNGITNTHSCTTGDGLSATVTQRKTRSWATHGKERGVEGEHCSQQDHSQWPPDL